MNPRSVDVVVLGGGPAGLAAAWRLAAAGRSVLLVERDAQVGGLARSVEVAGQRVDLGSHRLHPDCRPDLLQELHHLLGRDLLERPRNGRLRLRDRWVRFPLDAWDLVRHAPPGFVAATARDLAGGALRRHPTPPTDFAAAVRDRLGRTVADEFYAPYARKLYGVDATELSPDLADRRISATSGRRLLAKVRAPGRRQPGFWYPRQGFGQIPDALAQAAADAGAILLTGVAVGAVELAATSVRVTLGDGDVVEAGAVASTIPVRSLVDLLGDGVPGDVAAAAAGLRSRAAVVAHLVVAAARYTPFDAHYLPDPAVAVSRLSEPAHYRDAPPRSPTVLCAELPASPSDPWWTASDAELGELVMDALERSGLPAAPIREVRSHRLGHLYPVPTLDAAERLRRVDAWLAGQDRLVSFGRQGRFAQDNTHHALEMGWAAAEVLAAGTVDRPRWAAHLASFAEHVVAD